MIVGYWVLVIALIVGGLWACVTLAMWPERLSGQQQDARPGMDLHDRALPQLRAMAVDNPRLGALLDEVDRGRERQRQREAGSEPDGRFGPGWLDHMTADRTSLLAHCQPATAADLIGPARAHLAAGRPLEAGPEEWNVLTGHPGRFPSLYGATSVCVFIPAGLPVIPADIPRTFHGGAGHSTFWFERDGVVVGNQWTPLRLPADVVAPLGLAPTAPGERDR